MKSRVGIILNHLSCLSRFVQNPDIQFFGVKISQSPPGSQGLHCAALRRLGLMILCGVGLHMQLL